MSAWKKDLEVMRRHLPAGKGKEAKAAKAAIKRLEEKLKGTECPDCDGTGNEKCVDCAGTGECDHCNGTGRCGICDGDGHTDCDGCGGSGEAKDSDAY